MVLDDVDLDDSINAGEVTPHNGKISEERTDNNPVRLTMSMTDINLEEVANSGNSSTLSVLKCLIES